MLRKQIIDLFEKYLAECGQETNHFSLYENKFRYHDTYGEAFEFFAGSFKDIAEYAGWHFEFRHCSPEKFPDLLKDLEFPLVVFSAEGSSLTPMIIKPGRKREAWIDRPEGWVETRFGSDQELLHNMRSVGQMQQMHSYEPEKYGHTAVNANDILFLAGLRLSSVDAADHKQFLTPLRRFYQLLATERRDITTVYFFAIMIALVNLALPLGIQAIVGLMSGGLLLESVFVLMLLVILATMLSGWLQVKQLGIMEIIQQRLFARTAFDFAFRIPRLRLEMLMKDYTPELINRFFDVLNVQKSLPKILIDLTSAIIQIVFGLILLSFYHPYFILFGLLVVGFIAMVFYFTSAKGMETSIQESKYKYKVLYWLEELGRSIQSFKLAGYTSLPVNKTDRLLEKYISNRKKHFAVLVKQYSAIIGFKTIITAGLLILGGSLVFSEQINLGQFVASEIIIVLVINSVEKLISSLPVVYDILTALDKIAHVTDLPIENNTGREVEALGIDKHFELETVNLSYKFREALGYSFKNVNLKIQRGEKVCITGYNDSGKTSLIKTLAGLFHEYEGIIKVNGISIREVNMNSYRAMIADNLNLSDVFEGTLEENITMGRPGILLHDIMEACRLAHLDGFVACLKDGLQTTVLPSGSNFPSNVVKKILLARSFVQKPELILIDEFFHNVRSPEKLELLSTLFTFPSSMIVVSILPEVMKRCDRVLVMKQGEIVAQGTYEQLLNDNLIPNVQ